MRTNQNTPSTKFLSACKAVRLILPYACMLIILFFAATPSVYSQAGGEADRGITLEEYGKVKAFTFKNLDEDTYVKFDNSYILDRYQMKPPYVFKYSDGIERRFYLYKLLDNKTKKDLGMVAVYYLPAEKRAINLCIPNATAAKEVWARYIDDLKELGAKENGLLSTYSYVLSKEMSVLAGGSAGQPVSAAGSASDYDVCFPENALVLLPDGQEKPIHSIQSGEQIAAFDQASGKLVATTVTDVEMHEGKLYTLTSVLLVKEELTASIFMGGLAMNYTLEATANHPVMTDKGRKTMAELISGDNLYVYDGITGHVTSLKVAQVTQNIRKAPKVYNLVTARKNYLVNRTVVMDK
jgi:hypothetical protein